MSINLVLPIWAIAAIAIVLGLVVSKRKKNLGRSRLSEGEPAASILRIFGIGLGTWAICYLILGSVHQGLARRHGQPATAQLSEDETVLYGAITELTAFIVIMVATITTRPDGVRQTGIDLRRIPLGILGGLLGMALALPLIGYVNGLTVWALRHWSIPSPPHQLLEILKESPERWLHVAIYISAGLVAPVSEEMFFRGLLQTLLRNLLNNSWFAIVIAAAAFATVHMWWTWPQIFFLGLCLGYAYERSGNLWMSITMHAVFNLTSMWLFTNFG
jgi:membrane protease YdiL (CAAX protease family)